MSSSARQEQLLLHQSPQQHRLYGRMATDRGMMSMTHTYRNVPDHRMPVIDYDSPEYKAAVQASIAAGAPVPGTSGHAGRSMFDTYMVPQALLASAARPSFPANNGGGGSDDGWGRPHNPGLVSRDWDSINQAGDRQALPYDTRSKSGVALVQQQEQQVRRPLSAGHGTSSTAARSPPRHHHHHHQDERRVLHSRPASAAASLPTSLSSSLQAKDLHQMVDDAAGIALPAAKVYTADQFEHPVKMARHPLSQWEKPNVALSVRFLSSVEPQHRPQHSHQLQGSGAYRSASVDLGRWTDRTGHSSADDRLVYKMSLQGRSASSSPISFDNLRVGHNMRAMARMRGPPAGRHKQDMLDRMLDQQSDFDSKEQFRLAARDIVNSIVLVDSGQALTPEQQAQRDLAFRLLDEAFPVTQGQDQGQSRRSKGVEHYGERRSLTRPSSSHSTRSDSVLVRDKAGAGVSSPMSDSAYVVPRGRQAWSASKDISMLWQQSLSNDEHELLIEALRTELGLLQNGMKRR